MKREGSQSGGFLFGDLCSDSRKVSSAVFDLLGFRGSITLETYRVYRGLI